MGTHYSRAKESQSVALPIDDVALLLESQGLWRQRNCLARVLASGAIRVMILH